MLVPLAHHDWQTLRILVRGRGRAVTGKQLRPDMGRKTKDGKFLTQLVRVGLVKTEQPATDPFEATYQLTDLGKHAAEFGEFEIPLEQYKTLVRPA